MSSQDNRSGSSPPPGDDTSHRSHLPRRDDPPRRGGPPPSGATPPGGDESPDAQPRPDSSARAALRHPVFRRIFVASFLSNLGRWMQSVAQGVLAWELTESNAYLGFIVFAGLGPLALLSLLGGSLADTTDRRRLLLGTQIWQMFWSLVLAALLIDDHIDPNLLLVIVFVTALGQGIYAPAFTSVLPTLAGPENMGAAISLNSTQAQAARVLGPALGGWLTSQVGFAEVFALNALTYLFVITAVWFTRFPAPEARVRSLSERLFGGFRLLRRAPQVARPIVAMTLFSLFCLPFIGQLPAIAEVNLNVESISTEYGIFYAIFGCGAFAGALLVGTVLAQASRAQVVRATLVGFGVSLAWLTSIDSISWAYGAVFFVGLFYFILPTTLATMWHEHVTDGVRGRVGALWVLSFGGTVPFSNLVAGPVAEAWSLRGVLLVGSAAAFVLALTVRFRPGPVVGEELLASGP